MSQDSLSNENGSTVVGRAIRRLRGEADWCLSYVMGQFKRFPNDQALRIFAMRRSGHHAIVNWIRYHLAGKRYFLNDCKLGSSPFESAVWQSCVIRGFFGEHRVFRANWERDRGFTYKGTLLYNYEEADLRLVPSAMDASQEIAWIGPSRLRRDVLILRDPFNLLASKLKWAYGVVDRPSKPTLDDVRDARDLWKVYAREFLGQTAYLRDRINVSYNHWFTDRGYRDALGSQLGFLNQDRGVTEVAKWGPTLSQDSFDGLKYEGRAQEMKVLERWQIYLHDPIYRELLADRELHDLSEEIFGPLRGTEALLDKPAIPISTAQPRDR